MTAPKKNKLSASEQNRRNSLTSPWRRFNACQTRRAIEKRAELDKKDMHQFPEAAVIEDPE